MTRRSTGGSSRESTSRSNDCIQLILDLLSLARIESGQEPFEHRPLRLVPVVESCVEAHRGRAEAKNLNLTFDAGWAGRRLPRCSPTRRPSARSSTTWSTTRSSTLPSGRSVSVSCWGDQDAVCIEVADTGIGIPRDDLPRIFERFYRVDKARSRELGGTGLGLSIVKHLVESIGGQIDVTSRVGSGSRFTIHLPVPHVARPPGRERTDRLWLDQSNSQRERADRERLSRSFLEFTQIFIAQIAGDARNSSAESTSVHETFTHVGYTAASPVGPRCASIGSRTRHHVGHRSCRLTRI